MENCIEFDFDLKIIIVFCMQWLLYESIFIMTSVIICYRNVQFCKNLCLFIRHLSMNYSNKLTLKLQYGIVVQWSCNLKLSNSFPILWTIFYVK